MWVPSKGRTAVGLGLGLSGAAEVTLVSRSGKWQDLVHSGDGLRVTMGMGSGSPW